MKKSNFRLTKSTYFDQEKVESETWYGLERQVTFLGISWWVPEGYATDVGIIPYRKNKTWAEKIAKHYGIEMP